MSNDASLAHRYGLELGDLYRQLIESAPDALVVMADGGTIEVVNARAEQLFGYERDELLGQPIETLVPERFRKGHVAHRDAFLSAPKCRPMGSSLELFGQRKDGSEFPIEISLSPLRTAGGTLVSSAIRDVTERRRTEQKFRTLLESAPDAMVVVDALGKIVIVNAQAERLFGYRREELLGQAVHVLVPKRMRAQHQVHHQLYAQRPRPRAMGPGLDLVAVRRDGSEFPVEVSLSPLETDDGALVATAIRDTTERGASEAAARLASDRLLSAVESIHGTLALYDAEDRLVLCNSAARELLGRGSGAPIVGRTFSELLTDALDAGLFDLEARTATEFFEVWLAYRRNPFGVLDVRTSAGQTLRITERRTLEGGIVSTIWDVTEDVRREGELARARAQAETANSAKSDFLASMSHELRTPLNAILGFAQLLMRDKKTPVTERQREKLEYVLKGGEHLLRLIDDILDLSRIEAGRVAVSFEPVGVLEVLREVQSTLAPLAARLGVELLAGVLPDAALQVVADRTRFSQILINFGSNAIKYGKVGGSATFTVAPVEGGLVRVSVVDDGIGIPLDKQDKLFQPFQRAGQEVGPIEGTGIGLAICRRLASLMSGSVGFRSVAGQGSEFWLELPIHQSAPHGKLELPGTTAALALSEPSGPRYTVIYIEDNPSNIAFMREVLADFERIRLLAIPTAEVGIEVVRAQLPDLVVMDINLPGMSGFEAARRLREWPETAHIPIIALTAAAMSGDRKRATEAGFRKYLTKPVKIEELLETLEGILSGRVS